MLVVVRRFRRRRYNVR